MQKHLTPKEAAGIIDRNIFISAGAGTGKTYLLVQRFIEILKRKKADVNQIMAVTFTEKAAKEIKDRIRKVCAEMPGNNPVWDRYKKEIDNSRIGTIHGFCAGVVRENALELGIDPLSAVLSDPEGHVLLDKFLHNHIIDSAKAGDIPLSFMLNEYGLKKTKKMLGYLIKKRIDIDEINGYGRHGITEEGEKEAEANTYIMKAYREAVSAYEAYKKGRAVMDFDDLIIYAKRLFRRNKQIRQRYKGAIRYILVDEFQDTDFNQREIIFWIAEDKNSAADREEDIILSPDKLFIVGDKKQSIYRFRGACVSVFEDTKKILSKNGACYIELDTNMRSTPDCIKFFNRLFPRVMGEDQSLLNDYEAAYSPLKAGRDKSGKGPAVEFIRVPNRPKNIKEVRKEEAELVAKKIVDLSRSMEFRDIAVLFRAMTDIDIYEDALRRRNIPYYISSGSGFYKRQEIKDITNYLKLIESKNDVVSLIGVLRSPLAGISDNGIYWIQKGRREYMGDKDKKRYNIFTKQMSSIRKNKRNMSISGIVQEIISLTDYYAVLSCLYRGEQKISNVNKLIDTARRFEAEGIFTLGDFISHIDELVSGGAREGDAPLAGENADVVKILTIHKAKGLEFPVVIIPGVSALPRSKGGDILYERGFNSIGIKIRDENGELRDTHIMKEIKKDIEKKEYAESKRLFYTASTRARDRIIYSGLFEDKKGTWAHWLHGAAPILNHQIGN